MIQNGNGTGVISTISWAPVPGRLYAVQRSFDMQSWLTVADNIEPTPPLNSVTDAGAPPGGRVFYRMVAQRPSDFFTQHERLKR